MRVRTRYRPTRAAQPPSLPDALEEWVEAGLITPEQAAAIRQHEAIVVPPAPAPAASSLVIEALGYIGAVIMVVGAVILVNLYWDDLSTPLRLLIPGLTAVGLVGAGLAVPDRLGEAAGRLRAVLWAAAVPAAGTFFTVWSQDVMGRYDESSLIVVGPATSVVAAALWWWRRTWLQQLALLPPLVLSAIGVVNELGGVDSAWPGAAVWVVGLAFAIAAWSGRLEPRVTGAAFGILVAMFGALSMGNDLGIVIGLLTAVAMVALALLERSLPWLAVGAFGMLFTVPRAAAAWFPGRLSAALTLIVTGGLLVAAAIWVARHQATQGPPAGQTR